MSLRKKMEEPDISSYGRSTQKNNNIKKIKHFLYEMSKEGQWIKNPAGNLYNPSGIAV